jgi:hypothetical protein
MDLPKLECWKPTAIRPVGEYTGDLFVKVMGGTDEHAAEIARRCNAHRALVEACAEVAAFASCTEAADWKDASGRLIGLCRRAVAEAEEK